MNTKNKLVLIDGYGLFFRAFFAQRTLIRSDGLHTNGVYGFVRMILNILMDLNTTHIAIAFDCGKKTFRHNIDPNYKANRPPVPEEMIPQFPIIREVADVLHIRSIEKEGYEADDIIATLATKAAKQGFEVLIVSSDKDLMQLVDENIFLFDAVNKKVLDVQGVIDKWGVKPKQLLDVLSFMGDTADNISGVPNIGEKTAVQLIQEYGNIDNIVENIDNIKQKSRREAIKNNLDKLYLSKKLVTLCEDVELNLIFDDLLYKNINVEKFKDFLKKMEFISIANQIDKYFVKDEEDLFDNGHSMFLYKKICNVEDLKDIIDKINSTNKDFYFNIFTKNIDDYSDIISINFMDKEKKYIYYLNIEKKKDDLFNEKKCDEFNLIDVLNCLKIVFENKDIKKVSYNIKKNLRILKEYSIDINNFDDLSVMSYMLDSGKFSQNFSSLLKEYIETNTLITVDNIENNIGSIKLYEKNKNLDEIENLNLFSFSCAHIEYYFYLYDILSYRINNDKELLQLYNSIDKPLVEVLADMESCGVKINVKELNNLSLFFNEKISGIEKRIFDLCGEKFNINSPKQLSEILFDKLNIPKYEKPSKTGQYSTGVEILEKMYEDGFEIADRILEYRHYIKLKNTYSDILPTLIDKNDRLHTTFLNTVVLTGRLSSNNPNLQNIPIKTIDGEKIRKTFISKEGYSFIGIDYSQIELRILAEYAKVKNLIEAFKNNIDIHSKTAQEVFHVNEITPEMRNRAKAINFSIVYGTSTFGLAKRLKISNSEAKLYIDNYFKLYPEILDYMDNIRKYARENGFIKTMFGRKCYLDMNVKGVEKSFIERVAINAPIQGTGADIIKKAMVVIHNNLKEYNGEANLLLQIHDELLIEVKDELVEDVSKKVKYIMENIIKFENISLIANCKIAKNWGDAH